MIADEKNRELAFRLAGILEKGLTLSERVLHFMDSTFGPFSAEKMAEVVRDGEIGGREALLELIFFPDESIQVQIEGLLCSQNYTEKDEEAVADYLAGRIQSVELYFSGFPGKVEIAFSRESAKRFVSRLKIFNTPDRKLIHIVRKGVNRKRTDLVLVKIRNAAISMTDNVIDFLTCFFQKTASERPDFLACLDFLLEFLRGLDEESDIFQALVKRREICILAVEKAAEYEKQLAKYNMETMILQGIRNPCINRDEMKKTIDIIDTITLSVFSGSDSRPCSLHPVSKI